MFLLALVARLVLPTPCVDTLPHFAFTITSRVLGEVRTVNVYTPPNYSNASEAFPVLYMLDGGMAEDFPHVATTIDSLIRLRRIPPVLVVGIENTERRRDLTGPTTVAKDSTVAPHVGGSAAFRRFVGDEMMPEVQRRYRVTNQAVIVGESLAGLFVVETLLLEPALFRGYIALSPSVWWNGGEAVRMASVHGVPPSGTRRVVYLSAADEPRIAEGTARLAAILKAEPPGSLLVFYAPRPDLTHGTIFRALAPQAFIDVLGEGALGHD